VKEILMATFKDFKLKPEVERALDELGFTEPTEIQKKAIPLLLSAKKIDFHGQAQTGTGKTLAFGIPLLERIEIQKKVPQALIVAPTRELALQIADSLVQVAKHMSVSIEVIYGGAPMEDQIRRLRRGAQIVIGTPGRLNDHLRRKTLSLTAIHTLVLDEADIMLDMGFKDEVDEILNHLPKEREIWLFSATVKPGISQLMKTHMRDTVSVVVNKQQVGPQNTVQYFCIVPFRSRLPALARFIESEPDFYGFVFCQTKILTSDIAEQLIKRGYNVGALHGDMSQAQRNAIIKRFKQKNITILVATDVAARGIDIANLTHVINYSVPEDFDSYVHRVGRTGRAGKQGIAITFISKTELRVLQQIERRFHLTINPIDVPSRGHIINVRLKHVAEYAVSTTADQKVPYTDEIQVLVDPLTQDQIKKLLMRLIYDKFLATLDLEDIPYTHIEKESTFEQFQEIYLSVGTDDNIAREDVRDFLLATKVITEDQILTIRVIKRRSFVKLSGDCTPALMTSLRGKYLGGRPVNANLTCLVNEGGAPFSRGGRREQRSGRSPRPYSRRRSS
jgi:ATP-dependent RNA helicase DeaD